MGKKNTFTFQFFTPIFLGIVKHNAEVLLFCMQCWVACELYTIYKLPRLKWPYKLIHVKKSLLSVQFTSLNVWNDKWQLGRKILKAVYRFSFNSKWVYKQRWDKVHDVNELRALSVFFLGDGGEYCQRANLYDSQNLTRSDNNLKFLFPPKETIWCDLKSDATEEGNLEAMSR